MLLLHNIPNYALSCIPRVILTMRTVSMRYRPANYVANYVISRFQKAPRKAGNNSFKLLFYGHPVCFKLDEFKCD